MLLHTQNEKTKRTKQRTNKQFKKQITNNMKDEKLEEETLLTITK